MAKPFFLSYQGEDDTQLQIRYGNVITALMDAAHPSAPLPPRPPRDRIRVGFATSYFTIHSVSKLFRGWMRHLDRSRFEVVGYALSATRDQTSDEISRHADLWRAGDASFGAWRERILADAPDVLIYLELGMNTLGLQLASRRLAPIQAMTWGHPITSGLPTVDYFLSSAAMEPEDGDRHYRETLVRLPNLSIHYEPWPDQGGDLTRAGLGLREDAVVYVCCQSLFKYIPRHDHVFADIAARVPAAQFLFIGDMAQPATRIFRDRLAASFPAAGLDFARHVVITPPVPFESFPSLLRAGDIYLDSIGWSGGNTTLEAVTCDLPVVTWPTGLMRGRHSAGILQCMGLEARISPDAADYVATAARLADPAERARYRAEIVERRGRLFEDRVALAGLEEWLQCQITHGSINKDF